MSLLRPDIVIDVGSMDGSDAIHFKTLDPGGRVYAFEASPQNFEGLRRNVTARGGAVECVNQAVGGIDGVAEFLVWDEPAIGGQGANPGMHSTRPRAKAIPGSHSKLVVPACRLDTFVREKSLQGTIALWVDVEGASFDVLKGAQGISDQIAFAHVEVETEEIWVGQKTERDVLAVAQELGLVAIAHGAHPVQRDVIFVRSSFIENRGWLLGALSLACALQGPLTAAALRTLGGIHAR